VLVVTSVMFTFISFWRTAAIVLCENKGKEKGKTKKDKEIEQR